MAKVVYQVLLVDDDEDDYVVTRDLLDEAEQVAFELNWVDSYQAGLEAINTDRYDVGLFDYCLGAETGLELLQAVLKTGYRKPVILLTGLGNHDVDRQAMALGASDYLIKGLPLSAQLLERSILHAIERSKAEAKIRLLEHALQSIRDGIYMADEQGQLLFLNQALSELCGCEVDAMDGKAMAQLHPSILHQLLESQITQPNDSQPLQTELLVEPPVGEPRTVLLSESYVQDHQRTLRFGVVHDITLRKQVELERDRFFNLSLDLLFIATADGLFKRVNQAWKTILGYTSEELLGQPFWPLIHPEDRLAMQTAQTLLSQGNEVNALEIRYRVKDGSYLWTAWNVVPFPREDLIYGAGRDVSQRKESEYRLIYEALHDGLTGLDNRTCFLQRLEVAIKRSHRQLENGFAVLFIDLDNFKHINDTLGHLVGDQLLIQVARILSSSVREIDAVARLGGDEFIILLEDMNSLNDILKLVNRIQEELRMPFQLGHQTVFTSASIGIVLSTQAGQTTDEIVRDADIAMYRAKANGKGRYEVFNQAMYVEALHQVELENNLRQAIENKELCLYYQPIVSMTAPYEVEGFEVLLRWIIPGKGVVSASEFILIAEETGQISAIGEWVLETACAQFQAWCSKIKDLSSRYLSINLSGRQLRDPTLLATLDRILKDTKIPQRCLKLEITESSLIENTQEAVEVLQAIRSRGIAISLDDFGTGFSSLRYLHRFPIDVIKIDRSFVLTLSQSARERSIIEAIIDLAHALGFATVAEGIETMDQFDQLQQLGCNSGQGYLFARPLSGEQMAVYLDHHLSPAPVSIS